MNLDELKDSSAKYIVWNTRDLQTGKKKLVSMSEVNTIMEKKESLLIQASMIKKKSDVWASADYILVGESLESYCKDL